MVLIDGKYLCGRWGLTILNLLKGGAVVPVFTTAIAIFLMGCTTVILIKLLNIKKKSMIVLVSLILSTSPTFATTLIYTYCSEAYTLAMFLSVLLVYFIYNKKTLIYSILASVCVAVVMSLYQAYLGVFVGLCVIIPILTILKNEKNIKEIWKNIFKSIIVVILGLLIYYGITTIILKVLHMSLSSYGGANKIGINIFNTLPTAITQTYKSVYQFFFTNAIFRNTYWKRQYINMLLLVLMSIGYIIVILKNKISNPIKLITLFICTVFLPIAIASIEIIAQERSINLLMGASLYIYYILLISILDMLEFTWKEIAIKYISISLLLIMIWGYIISDQCTYLVRKTIYDQTYSYATRIIDRMESCEEYKRGMPICFAGSVNVPSTPIVKRLREMSTGANAEIPEVDGSYQNGKTTMKVFLDRYCGININWCTTDEYKKIINSDEFKELNVFPKEGSTKVINGIMVVKLSSNPPIM